MCFPLIFSSTDEPMGSQSTEAQRFLIPHCMPKPKCLSRLPTHFHLLQLMFCYLLAITCLVTLGATIKKKKTETLSFNRGPNVMISYNFAFDMMSAFDDFINCL